MADRAAVDDLRLAALGRVGTASLAPLVTSTRAVSTITLITNAPPVSRWHQVQWQQLTNNGAAPSRYLTAPHVQPPSSWVSMDEG
jgi:hypothetical protein